MYRERERESSPHVCTYLRQDICLGHSHSTVVNRFLANLPCTQVT